MELNGFIKSLHQINKIRYRPVLVSKIAKGYFRRLILQKPSLRICEFSITAACQSRCEFCYASKFADHSDKVLSLQEIKTTWQQAQRLGAFSAMLFGGEPLLHPHFLKIIEALEPKNNLVTFTTNAINLTEDLVREVKALGVFLVNISINSMDPEINDRLRGYKGHFNKAMQALDLCNKHGLDVFLPVATAKPYWAETLRIAEFAKRHGYGVVINLMCPMGRAEDRYEDLFDKEFWGELRKLYNAHPNMRSDYDVNLDMRIGCPSGHEKIHIAPYGDVTGCSMQAASFGNVRDESLETIVARMRKFRHYAVKKPHCLIAVDKEYIANYMDFAKQYNKIPYAIMDNPYYAKDKG